MCSSNSLQTIHSEINSLLFSIVASGGIARFGLPAHVQTIELDNFFQVILPLGNV